MQRTLNNIYKQLCKINGKKPARLPVEKLPEIISSEIKSISVELEESRQNCIDNKKRINSINKVVLSLARLEYDQKADISNKQDHFDALALGINMLGEELKSSTVSLKEKETLLKEIHHRVKNNLQIVSSLLKLQSDNLNDPFLSGKFKESLDRVKSMALIHEKLYKSGDLAHVNFTDYLKDLVENVSSSYNAPGHKIKTTINCKLNTLFDLETAIPCGLIVNELLSNCYKYAFKGKTNGSVIVSFINKPLNNKDKFILSVSDNGVGIPKIFFKETPHSLGLQLVHLLTEQLNGKIKIKNSKGTEITISFPQS